jgi:Tfp pilus assembly protein PilO
MLINSLAKSSRTSRITLSAAIVGIVTVAAYNWLVSPHTKYLYAVHQYRVLAEEVTKKNQVIQVQQANRKKEIEQLQSEFDKVRTALFTPAEAKRFFGDIEAACKEMECIIYSMNFLPAQADRSAVSNQQSAGGRLAAGDNPIIESSVLVNFVGDYSNIAKFLTKLTNQQKKVAVRSLKISAFSGKPSPLQCEATVTIYVVGDKEIFTNE